MFQRKIQRICCSQRSHQRNYTN